MSLDVFLRQAFTTLISAPTRWSSAGYRPSSYGCMEDKRKDDQNLFWVELWTAIILLNHAHPCDEHLLHV